MDKQMPAAAHHTLTDIKKKDKEKPPTETAVGSKSMEGVGPRVKPSQGTAAAGPAPDIMSRLRRRTRGGRKSRRKTMRRK